MSFRHQTRRGGREPRSDRLTAAGPVRFVRTAPRRDSHSEDRRSPPDPFKTLARGLAFSLAGAVWAPPRLRLATACPGRPQIVSFWQLVVARRRALLRSAVEDNAGQRAREERPGGRRPGGQAARPPPPARRAAAKARAALEASAFMRQPGRSTTTTGTMVKISRQCCQRSKVARLSAPMIQTKRTSGLRRLEEREGRGRVGRRQVGLEVRDDDARILGHPPAQHHAARRAAPYRTAS